MMKHEFEELAGYEVSTESYNNIIEPMYMATNMTKQEFVKCINRKQFEVKHEKTAQQIKLEARIKEEIESLKNEIQYYQDTITLYKEYYEMDHDKAWKINIQNYQMYIKTAKARINALKFVMS